MKSATVAIMRECWKDPPEIRVEELEDYAHRILRMVLHGESKIAIEEYVAARQHEFGIASPTAYKDIVARIMTLVNTSNKDSAR